MAEEEKKVSSRRAKKPAVKKEKPQVVKQEAKQETPAPVKKSEAKKEIVVARSTSCFNLLPNWLIIPIEPMTNIQIRIL